MLFNTNKDFTVTYELKDSDVVFVGIPFSYGSISSKSNYGPLMVRKSLEKMEDFTKKGNIFEKFKVCDVGDVEIVPGSYEKTKNNIQNTIKEIKENNSNAFLVFMGGNHLVSLPVCESLKPKTIVQLDAHADLRKDYKGSKFMQQTWAYHYYENKEVNLIQIGSRSLNKEEREYKSENNIEDKLENLEKPIHLTIDMDVFDPAYVKTGLPEPNGLTPENVFEILKKIDPDSMDVTEIADNSLPSKTGFLASKCILKILENKRKK